MRLPDITILAASSVVYSESFPLPDVLIAQFAVEQPNAGGSLAVELQHSADGGVTWVSKTSSMTLLPNATISATGANVKTTSDSGSTPSLPLGRFGFTTTTTAQCRIKVDVAGRSY